MIGDFGAYPIGPRRRLTYSRRVALARRARAVSWRAPNGTAIMDFKVLFGLTVFPAAIFGGTVLACLSNRIRDVYFVLLIFLAPWIERMDVNFVSREWYRGTARGFQFSPLDVLMIGLLLSSLLVPRRGESRGYWPASFGWMLLVFFYLCFNIGISDPKLFGLFELSKFVQGTILMLAIAFYVRSEREVRLLIWSVIAMLAFQCLLALKQRYVDGIHRVPGSLEHPNGLSVLLCLTAPLLVAAFNSDWPKQIKAACACVLPLVCVAEILTISRAGVVILPMVLLGTALATMSFRITPRKLAIVSIALMGVTAITAKAWNSLLDRFYESTLKEEYGKQRNMGRGYYLTLAREIATEETFGVGLNNWSYWVSNKYGPRLGYRFVPYVGPDRAPSWVLPSNANVDEAQAAPAHNLGALTLGELGIPGLVLFGCLWLRWFQMGGSFLWPRAPDPMRRLGVGLLFGLAGVALHSWTEWAFRQSGTYYMFHIFMGALASLYYAKRQARRAELESASEWDDEALMAEVDRPVHRRSLSQEWQ